MYYCLLVLKFSIGNLFLIILAIFSKQNVLFGIESLRPCRLYVEVYSRLIPTSSSLAAITSSSFSPLLFVVHSDIRTFLSLITIRLPGSPGILACRSFSSYSLVIYPVVSNTRLYPAPFTVISVFFAPLTSSVDVSLTLVLHSYVVVFLYCLHRVNESPCVSLEIYRGSSQAKLVLFMLSFDIVISLVISPSALPQEL